MATAEPPPKKRKVLDPLLDSSLSPSQEEVLRKRRNREEVRTLLDCYRRIRLCVERNDPRLMPDLEQAYISLISASRALYHPQLSHKKHHIIGCTSVQRIVAELIPQYASFFPTALEAAAKVSINMYHWSLSIISRGEDTDLSAYHTVRACILGLAKICHTASHKAPSSSVIAGICSAVFTNVLTFFVSTFEGKDIYHVGSGYTAKLLDPMEFLFDLKEKEDESGDELQTDYLYKLFELRVLCLLCIFITSPRNVMEACFEIGVSGEIDRVAKSGVYFVNQICHDLTDSTASKEESGTDDTHKTRSVVDDHVTPGTSQASQQDNCYLQMVINKDPSFKAWIVSKHKNLPVSHSPRAILEISSHIDRVLASLPEEFHEKEIEDFPMSEEMQESPENLPSNATNSAHINLTDSIPEKRVEQQLSNTDTATPNGSPNIFDFNRNGVSSFVVSASKELWVSCHGTNATESSLKSKFEEFGPLDRFLFYLPKHFALIEYKNITDSIKAHGFMQGSTMWGGSLKVKYLDRGLGSKGFVEGVAVGDSCYVYVGNVLSLQERDDILSELTSSGLKGPINFLDLKGENAVLMEFGSAEEATVAKARIRSRACTSRSDGVATNKFTTGRFLTANMQNDEPQRTSRTFYSAEHISCNPSPRLNNESFGPCTPSGQVFQPGWFNRSDQETPDFSSGMDPLFSGPLSTSMDRQLQLRPHQNFSMIDPKLAALQITPIRPPVLPPSVSASFLPPPPPYPPQTNQVSQGIVSTSNFHMNPTAPLPFIPSSVTPFSQLPRSSLQNPEKVIPPLAQVSGMSLQNSGKLVPPHFPPPSHMPPVIMLPHISPSSVPPDVEMPNIHKWKGTLSKSGVNYCAIFAVREESGACRYVNGASEPKDWPIKLDVTKRTDLKHVRTTFSNTPPNKREVCRLLPASSSDQKGFHDFIAYLNQRECAGVIKIPGIRPMWSRLLFILSHSPENCNMLGINQNPLDCLIALVLPKDTNSE
ncbi:nucleic acid binding protein [Rhynchospora pubera]|uniref:Nucleic acid binding protein n=1 Tax=Rhynchospora pubera TaxID=906938 RepID=A0AAV8HK41_9POAL|nr:nucleic acid binding protein [Rhynchospora pubera]